MIETKGVIIKETLVRWKHSYIRRDNLGDKLVTRVSHGFGQEISSIIAVRNELVVRSANSASREDLFINKNRVNKDE